MARPVQGWLSGCASALLVMGAWAAWAGDKITGESKSIRPSPLNVTNHKQGDTYRFFWDSPMIHSTETGALRGSTEQEQFA